MQSSFFFSLFVRLMDDHLREGDLHALFVKEDLEVPRQHALGAEDVLLGHVHRKLQIDAAVGQRVYAEVARRRQIQIRVLLLQFGERLFQQRLQLAWKWFLEMVAANIWIFIEMSNKSTS